MDIILGLSPKDDSRVEYSLWKTGDHSSGQEILQLLWNLKVHYCVHKSPSFVAILSWIDPAHVLMPYFLKKSWDPIYHCLFHLCLGLPRILPFRASDQNLVFMYHLFHPDVMQWGVGIMELLIMQFSLTLFMFCLLRPNIPLSTLFSNTHSLYSCIYLIWAKIKFNWNSSYSYKHEACELTSVTSRCIKSSLK
jgi:hypothetical protein